MANSADIDWQEGREKYLGDPQGRNPNGPDVIVAVIDTGIDYNHPDLKKTMWKNPGEIAGNGIDDDSNGFVDDVYGINLLGGNPRGDPIDQDGHGTHCAGTIAAVADNDIGIAGVAGISLGKVKLMAIRALPGVLSGIMDGLDYAVGKGARISSNSWGGRGGGASVLQRFFQDNPNHLFVSAAGNSNRKVDGSDFPASAIAPTHISVAASTIGDVKAGFSNYGTPFVNVFAPGTQIFSTWPNSRYRWLQGTSMACPHVTGLAALLMSLRNTVSPAQIKELIEQNVQKKSQYKNVVTSGGLINVESAISALIGSGSSDPRTGK